MKYNVFKRPMFRTGGLSQGTGITSGLDTPRIGYVRGGRIATNGRYNFNIAGLVSPSMATEYAMGQGTYTPGGSGSGSWRAALEKARAARKPSKFLEWLKKFKPSQANLARIATTPGVGIGTTAALPVGAAGLTHMVQKSLPEELKGEGGLFDTSTAAWGGMGAGAGLDPEVDEILRGKKVSDSKTSDGTPITTAKGPPGGGDPDMFYKKPVEEVVEEDTPSLIGEAPKSEEDILLEQLGDTSLSKGEKALMLSEIIGQKGWKGKTDKAIELMKSKTKSDRQLKKDIAKLKYLQRGKERIAGIEAGEATTSQKDIKAKVANSIAIARQKGLVTTKDGITYYDGKTREQIEGAIYDKLLDAQKNTLKQTIVGKNQPAIVALRAQIRKERLKAKPGDEKAQAKIRELEMQLEDMMNPGKYGIAEGGRVGYAQGTPMAEPQVAATQTANANTTENTRPVNKLTFAELRNRLPKEITDDVVQLLSNSEEALQDFAYIQTQEDINKFNVKYGVNVILPPQA